MLPKKITFLKLFIGQSKMYNAMWVLIQKNSKQKMIETISLVGP